MADVRIIDTGYANIAKTGTAESFKANGGSSIQLRSVEISYQRGSGIDNTPEPSAFRDTKINLVSVKNPLIVIQGILDRKNVTDMNLMVKMDALVQTKGVKLLYYDSTIDGYRDITDSLGTENLNGGTNQRGEVISDAHSAGGGEIPAIPHLHIHVTGFRVRHLAQPQLLRYELTCEVTR